MCIRAALKATMDCKTFSLTKCFLAVQSAFELKGCSVKFNLDFTALMTLNSVALEGASQSKTSKNII